jgi:serine O-acetyltransferase
MTFKDDIDVIFDKDPAAKNIVEVLLCCPGLHALWAYRVSHKLNELGLPLIPRLISYVVRIITGIEIHPGAIIGRRFFIDHGIGVVIGETAEIGDDVLLYQGVTLGGTGKEHGKRHPTLENSVVVGAGAKVLGNITIGAHSKIGAGSVVVEDVPENSTVIGVPGHVVLQKSVDDDGILMHHRIPDPIQCKLNRLEAEINELKEKLEE